MFPSINGLILTVKKRAKRIYNKGHHHAKKIAQRGTAIMFALILFVGILLPAGVGYAMEKMDGVAVNTLIASSGDSTNSSVILSKSAEYWNGQYVYRLDVVSMNGWDYVMTDTQNQVGTASYSQVLYCWAINASVLKNTALLTKKLNKLLDEKTIKNIQQSAKNLNSSTAKIDALLPNVDKFIDNSLSWENNISTSFNSIMNSLLIKEYS